MLNRLTITDVAEAVGVTPRTIMRWEKAGKIRRPKRDWRGWRFYTEEDIKDIKKFFESPYEFNRENGILNAAVKLILFFVISMPLVFGVIPVTAVYAGSAISGISETRSAVDIRLDQLPAAIPYIAPMKEDVKYTLGPDDIIAIEVRRHPEFSGEYTVNSEGMIEYKFVGDIHVARLTKVQLKERLYGTLSKFVVAPEIDISIVAYLSKVYYVVGEVGNPGKFYMRGNTVTVRDALVAAGLPLQSAAMRRSRLINPDKTGKENYATVDVCKLLYEGNLKENLEMKPGNVLYVPATIVAKVIRVISPVTDLTARTAGAAASGAIFMP